jgi:hypothetical protein
MNIKILTPEYVVFEGEVDSILLPGKSGNSRYEKPRGNRFCFGKW